MEKVLFIDLTERKVWSEEKGELFKKFLGGSGVAINLLHELCPEKEDPFSPENPIIFAVGPLLGVYPSCTKTIAMFKSPLTGNLGESHAGGRFGTALRCAGYGAVVIKGVSAEPVYLDIYDNDKVLFKRAASFLGLPPRRIIDYLKREDVLGLESVIATGLASEKFVAFAGVIVDKHFYFGRLGLGTIFGAKNLKAIRITSDGKIPIKNVDEYKILYDEIYEKIVKTDAMAKYHNLGTPQNVHSLNEIRGLPTRNFLSGYFEEAETISGEYFADNILLRKMPCSHCPIGCKHVALVKEQFAAQHELEVLELPYDYEPIYSLGSNLGVSDTVGVLKLISTCDLYGLDAMITGNLLAWVTEAFMRNLVTEKETLGLKPKWGYYETYIKMIENIVKMPNSFYASLAMGKVPVKEGESFYMTIGGNGVAGYHTGLAQVLGTAIGARHSHVSNAGYSLDQKYLGKELPPEEIVDTLITEEQKRCILESCGVCLFARRVYDLELISKALNPLGWNYSADELREIGKEIYRLKFKFKFREGFQFETLHIPERFFETPSANGLISKKKFFKALNYAAKRIKELAEIPVVEKK